MTFALHEVDRVSDPDALRGRFVAATSEPTVRLSVLVDKGNLGTVAVVVPDDLALRPLHLPKRGVGGVLLKYTAGELALKHAPVEPILPEQDF